MSARSSVSGLISVLKKTYWIQDGNKIMYSIKFNLKKKSMIYFDLILIFFILFFAFCKMHQKYTLLFCIYFFLSLPHSNSFIHVRSMNHPTECFLERVQAFISNALWHRTWHQSVHVQSCLGRTKERVRCENCPCFMQCWDSCSSCVVRCFVYAIIVNLVLLCLQSVSWHISFALYRY